jgi:hypothetical protein
MIEYDDGIGELYNKKVSSPSPPNDNDSKKNVNSNGVTSDGGEELAQKFYSQVRQQEQSSSSPSSKQPSISEDEVRKMNPKPFSRRQVMSVSKRQDVTSDNDINSVLNNPSSSAERKIKYTGQQRRPGDSPLFGGNEETPSRSSPRESMMEREFQIASRGAGFGLGIQAAIAVFALAFYIYVGVSGGIVSSGDGDAADYYDDTTIQPFEQVMPIPRDREASVWL